MEQYLATASHETLIGLMAYRELWCRLETKQGHGLYEA